VIEVLYTHQVFELVSGMANGVALALLVGRVDSKFIDSPRAVVAVLYLYAIIQPLWPFLGAEPYRAILSTMALLLKVLLFLFVTFTVESGLLTWYFVQVRRLIDEGGKTRTAFLKGQLTNLPSV
jgi:hypothetical protein